MQIRKRIACIAFDNVTKYYMTRWGWCVKWYDMICESLTSVHSSQQPISPTHRHQDNKSMLLVFIYRTNFSCLSRFALYIVTVVAFVSCVSLKKVDDDDDDDDEFWFKLSHYCGISSDIFHSKLLRLSGLSVTTSWLAVDTRRKFYHVTHVQ